MKEVSLQLRRILVDPAKPPEVAHAFFWAKVDTEFLFEVAFVDLHDMHGAVRRAGEGEEPGPVPALVNYRFSLTAEALNRLHETVQAMRGELEEKSRPEF